VSCSNGTHASRQFLSFLLRWRQPQPRNRSISKEEERHPRAPPLRLTQRLPLTQRPHRARRLRHTSPHHVPLRKLPLRALRRTSPHHVTRLRKLAGRARRKRPALHRSTLAVRPAAHPHRRWRGARRRRAPRQLSVSSRKSADGAAAVARELRNRASSKIWRSPGWAALPLRHRPGAAAATPRHNKTWLRNRV